MISILLIEKKSSIIFQILCYRPNFLAWCNPDLDSKKVDCGTTMHPKLVTDYVCRGPVDGNANFAGQEEKSKMSFISGHASLSWQATTFIVLYLQSKFGSRNIPKHFHLAVPFLQVAAIIFAYFTSLSRVMDYQHHPGDVIGKTPNNFFIKY